MNTNKKKDYSRHMGKRAAAYLRASESELQSRVEVEQSIIDQDNRIRSFCDKNGYSRSHDHFEADRTSGTAALEERTGMKKLLEAARRHEFDFLIVSRIDRLARNTKLLLRIFREFEMCGVSIKSVTEKIDTSDANGRLLMNMLAATSEAERELSSARRYASMCSSCQSWEEISDIHEHQSD